MVDLMLNATSAGICCRWLLTEMLIIKLKLRPFKVKDRAPRTDAAVWVQDKCHELANWLNKCCTSGMHKLIIPKQGVQSMGSVALLIEDQCLFYKLRTGLNSRMFVCRAMGVIAKCRSMSTDRCWHRSTNIVLSPSDGDMNLIFHALLVDLGRTEARVESSSSP